MDLNKFDGKCVRIITTSGEVFEGVVSYDDREYAFPEYGHDQEALRLTPTDHFQTLADRVVPGMAPWRSFRIFFLKREPFKFKFIGVKCDYQRTETR